MNIVEALRPHVTSFSADLQQRVTHGQEVRVGGTIRSIMDMSVLHGDSDDTTWVYLILDDGVGENYVMMPSMYFHELQEERPAISGDVILVDAYAFVYDMKERGRDARVHSKEHPTEDHMVKYTAFDYFPLPEEPFAG